MNELLKKNLVLIDYLSTEYKDFKIKAEYSTNKDDEKVIVVQEQPGNQIVFYEDIDPLFNYYEIVIYGLSIQEMKNTATLIGSLKESILYMNILTLKQKIKKSGK